MGYVTPDDLARALSVCLNLEYVNLSEVGVDQEVLGIISEDGVFWLLTIRPTRTASAGVRPPR